MNFFEENLREFLRREPEPPLPASLRSFRATLARRQSELASERKRQWLPAAACLLIVQGALVAWFLAPGADGSGPGRDGKLSVSSRAKILQMLQRLAHEDVAMRDAAERELDAFLDDAGKAEFLREALQGADVEAQERGKRVLARYQARRQKPVRIDFRVEVRSHADRWTFAFDGTTNLPEGTVLRLTVYHPTRWEETDPATGAKTQKLIPDYLFDQNFEAETRVRSDGKIRHDLYNLRRPPFSLPYRARIRCHPQDQSEATLRSMRESLILPAGFALKSPPAKGVGGLKQAPADPASGIEAAFDFTWGDPRNFAREQVESAKRLQRDLAEVKNLFDEIRARYRQELERKDPPSWQKFLGAYSERVAQMQDRNADRFQMFRCIVERLGSFAIADLSKLLVDLAQQMETSPANPEDVVSSAAVREQERALEERIDQTLESTGVSLANVGQLRGPVEELAAVLAEAEQMGRKAADAGWAEWDRSREDLERRFWTAALQLGAEPREGSKRLHSHVVEVTEAFRGLVEAVRKFHESPSAGLRQAVIERAKSVRDARAALLESAGIR